jgi:ubiquinone/menaquinone biosynthesis C-methylase UbiE
MARNSLSQDFYERIKPRLHQRVGRELRLANRVFDLGCGSCDLERYLAGRYEQSVTGVDVSSRDFPERIEPSVHGHIHCIQKDAGHLDFVSDKSVDAVAIMWSLHEMKHGFQILREAHRILRPGGEILIVEFPKGSLAQRLWNEDYYSPQELTHMLNRSGFQESRTKLIERGQIIWATAFRPASATQRGTDQ